MAKTWTSNFDVKKLLPATREGVAQGLEAGAALVLADSQRRVPYIKGELSRSADSGLVSETRSAITYRDRGAVAAHERTDIKPANGRERKFLENAMNATRNEVADTIARAIRGKLGT